MSNATDKLSTANRALLFGAIAGGSATIATSWRAHQNGVLSTEALVGRAAVNAVKTGLATGATTYVAEKMAGRPALSLLTILSVGAAGVYLLEQAKGLDHE